MATPKYKKQFDTMLETNKKIFAEYEDLQEKYNANPKKYKEELTDVKLKLQRIIRKNEDMLCAKSENARFAMFSDNLAMKFWEEVRTTFPQIDEIPR